MTLDFEKNLRAAILNNIKEIVDEEAAEAAKRVEKRVRDNVGGIAATILSRFSMEPYGQRGLKIIVDFENVKEGPCRTR